MTDSNPLRQAVRDNWQGMLTDLAFAVVWVTMVTVLFALLEGPRWAFYLCMLAGIVAYFGLFGPEGDRGDSG